MGTPAVGVPVGELWNPVSLIWCLLRRYLGAVPILIILFDDNAVLRDVAHGDGGVGDAA